MADQFFERRPTGQFPTKFSALPPVGGSPTPGAGNQLVPVGAFNGVQGLRSATAEPDDRIRQMETRITIAEKSNRALLEEVVRLQSELKGQIRRNEETLRDERQARLQMENSMRASNDLIAQMSSRLKNTEERVQEEKSAVSALMNHSKTIEHTVMGGQQDLIARRDFQASKLQELRSELDDTVRAKEQLERVTYQLVDELRGLKGRFDAQMMDFGSVAAELKNKSRRLEEDSRQNMDYLRKTGETQTQAEQNTSQLRSQVETRLAELRDVLIDLRTKQDQETQERRMMEQQSQLRMSDLTASVAEQARKREEAMHALSVVQREREHAAESERIKMQSKIAEIAEEVSKKILQKEMRLREESQQKYAQIEQMMMGEQEARQRFERSQRDDAETRFEGMKRLTDEEMSLIREQQKNDKKKNTDTLHRLNDALNLVEKQLEEQRRQQDKLIAAEIKSRKQHERDTRDKMDSLQEKLSMATATLQQAIGGMDGQISSRTDKLDENITEKLEAAEKKWRTQADELQGELRRDMKGSLQDSQAAQTRALTDMDARLAALNSKISATEDNLEAKLSAASAVQTENLREKIESIVLWQNVTQQTLKEMQNQQQRLPEEVYALEERYKLLKAELDSRVQTEADSRIRDVENLKRDMRGLSRKGSGKKASDADIEACQASVRKLAESIQTVKTVLGMKIQSEQKLRIEEVKKLQDELIKLRGLIEPLLDLRPEPAVFVKPQTWDDKKDVEEKASDINKWSMYTAYRWLKWKTKWMYVVWYHKAGRKDKKPPEDEDPEEDKDRYEDQDEKEDDDKKKGADDDDDDKKDDDADNDDNDDKKDDDDDKKSKNGKNSPEW